MANALKYYGQPETVETERFVRFFDKLFDCLNVRTANEDLTKKKPNLKPYRAVADQRLAVSPVAWQMHTWGHYHAWLDRVHNLVYT